MVYRVEFWLLSIFVHVYSVTSIVPYSLQPYGLQPAKFLNPWDFPGKILEWVAMPFSRETTKTRDETSISWIASGFFTDWTTREVHWVFLDLVN